MQSTTRVCALALGTTMALVAAGTGDASRARQDLPPTMVRVPDGQAVLFTARAKGFQIYESQAREDDPKAFEWVFAEPRADLTYTDGKKIGTHYAGPTWELTDGSKVTAKWVAESSHPGDLAWQLLKKDTAIGELREVSYVLRVDTRGGLAPMSVPTSAGKVARVPYTATYIFLVTAP